MKSKKRRKRKKNNENLVKMAVLRIGAILIIAVFGWIGIWAVMETIAYYNDIEIGSGFFSAAALDFFIESRKQDNRFQTYTQGGWGSVAQGNNPGAYRDANFALAFSEGVIIGIQGEGEEERSILFTSAAAVENFLPAGGEPKALDFDYTDPVVTEAGVLAGQVLALTLNVEFDLYDPNFAPSPNNLKDYIIDNPFSICNGMSVGQVLDEANLVLSGLVSSFSPSDISGCADWINEKFNQGGNSISQFATIIKTSGDSLDFQYVVEAEETGGNDDFCNSLHLEALLEGTSYYSGDLLDFVSSLIIYSTSADDWELVITLPEDSNSGDSCSFDFVFSGWQTNLPLFGGFSDIERVDDPIYGFSSVLVESEEPVLIMAEEPVIVDDSHQRIPLMTVINKSQATIEEPVAEPEIILETIIIDGLFIAAPLNPIIIEETPIVEEAPVSEESIVEEPPVIEESLVVEEEPIIIEESIVEEPPVIEELPAIEEPPIVEEPIVVEEPLLIEETPIIEEPIIIEEPPIENNETIE